MCKTPAFAQSVKLQHRSTREPPQLQCEGAKCVLQAKMGNLITLKGSSMKFQKVQKLKMVSKPYPTMQKSAPADLGNAQKPHFSTRKVLGKHSTEPLTWQI